ncbi:unnamed protein product [Cylicostephanus goldi]|uniref:Uncharacterized protein n=1 Tax=Cylicostephanus goldi TaxID=71465 RepID=A0A3P6U8B9_CYLGO|nr:unnamed protein product [Cylicostephanus goldi]
MTTYWLLDAEGYELSDDDDDREEPALDPEIFPRNPTFRTMRGSGFGQRSLECDILTLPVAI